MINTIFIDFYGTLVHEDGEIIKIITDKIANTGKVNNKSEIGEFWWNNFSELFSKSNGANFQTQRALELISLQNTIAHFSSTESAEDLSKLMFEHWQKPPIFDDTIDFLQSIKLPVYVVSNIDTHDIMQAISYHNLKLTGVFTSEQAKSYKPNKAIFEFALA